MSQTPLTIPRDMQRIIIPGMPPTEIQGKLLGNIDNDRRGRPRWAELELYRYIDTNSAHISDRPELSTYAHELYLLHTMGHSVVYHRLECDSNRGVEAAAAEFAEIAEFPDDLEPCANEYVKGRLIPGCYPPPMSYDGASGSYRLADGSEVPGTARFRVEVIRHVTYKCRDADAVLERLSRPSKTTCDVCNGGRQVAGEQCWRCEGSGFIAGPPALTAPGARLIETVKWKDPDIRQAAERTVRL